MKVNLYETVEVSNEQRVKLGRLLDGTQAKKRIATRDELKAYIWQHGQAWDVQLEDECDQQMPSGAELDDNDLI